MKTKNLALLTCGIYNARAKEGYKEDFLFNSNTNNIKQTIMKMQVNRPYSQLTKVEFEDLTSIVAEAIAVGIHRSKTTLLFTAADLWNIQRRGKTRIQRRKIA